MNPLRLYLLWRSAMTAAGHSALGWKTVKLAVYLLRSLPMVSPRLWRSRMRKCMRCPVYYRPLRTCGRTPDAGCRCSMPLKALLRGAECWANQEGVTNLKGWA